MFRQSTSQVMQLSKDIYEQIGRGEAVPEDRWLVSGVPYGLCGAWEDLRNFIFI